jgi:hypothetical protein
MTSAPITARHVEGGKREFQNLLKSITSDVKHSDLVERDLVFSDIELLAAKKPAGKHSHYKALCNLNRSL